MAHKNTFYKNIFLALATTAALLLSSCNNLLPPAEPAAPSSSGDEKYLVISATLESSLQTSRSAVPSNTNILNSLVYAADFHASTGTTHDYRVGTYNATTKKITFSFSPPIENLTNYVLDIYGFPSGTEITSNMEVGGAILKGSVTNLSVEKDAITLEIASAITMKPYSDSSTLGKVNLSVSVPSGYTLTCSDDTNFSVTGSAGAYTVKQKEADGIEKGTYTVTFTLKKDDVSFYAWTEKIIVYAGMVTDHWNTGTVSGSSRVIPASQISTSFYVRGSGGTWYSTNLSGSTADNENSGTMSQPLATVQEAINRIKSINDGSTNYTIYVDGTVQNNATGTVADFSEFARGKISIVGLGTSQAVLKGNKAEISPTSKNSVVIISSGVELTLENLLITDGETSGNGGGINNAGKLTMTGCTVNGNSASYGGGIYVVSGASLTLTDCVIGNENATSVSNVNSWETGNGNCAGNSGGGIYIDTGTTSSPIALAATVTINSSFVSQNYCTNSGGGIGESTDKKYKNLTINNSTIKYNYAGSNGGGVVVYSQDNNSSISSTEIFGNEANSNGGGIYIASSSFLKLTNCTNISNNKKEASSNGSGIYLNGTLRFDGDVKIDSSNDVYVCYSAFSPNKISLENGFAPTINSVATITPATYPSGTIEVTVLSGKSNLVSAYCGKFAVTPDGSTNWEIDVNGKLVKQVLRYSTVYLDAADGGDANEGTESSPVKTLANALAHLDTSVENPTIMLMSPYLVGVSDNLDFSSSYTKQITIKRYKEFKQKEVNNMKYDYMLNFSSGTKTISNVIIDGSYEDGYVSTNAMSSLLYISGADVKIGNNTILQNNYGITSSGIYLGTNCSVEIDGAEIKGNKNDVIYSYTNGTVTIKKCSFTGNSSGSNSNRASIHSKNITLSGEIADGDSIYITTGSMDNPITIGSGFSSVNPITITNDIGSSGIGKSILTGYVDTDVCEKFELGNSAYIIEYKSGTQPKGVIALKSPNSEAITVEIDGVGYSASLSSQKDFDSDISLTVMKGSNNITSSSSCDYKMYVYTMDDYSAPIETFDNTPINLSSTYKTNLGITKFRVRVVVIVDGRLVIDDYINVTLN